MTADTWSALVAHHFNLAPTSRYCGNDLQKASNEVSTNQMDVNMQNVPLDRNLSSVVCSQCSTWLHCFLAMSQEGKPITHPKSWLEICCARDLLNKVVTRSATLELVNKRKCSKKSTQTSSNEQKKVRCRAIENCRMRAPWHQTGTRRLFRHHRPFLAPVGAADHPRHPNWRPHQGHIFTGNQPQPNKYSIQMPKRQMHLRP